MSKQIEFESNHKRVGSKFYWFEFDSFIKRIEISEFGFDSFIKLIFSSIRLIRLVELINELNRIHICLLFIYPITNSLRIELNYDLFIIRLEKYN